MTLAGYLFSAMASDTVLILDDRSSGDLHSLHGPAWRLVTDAVMGGVSTGSLVPDTVAGRSCVRLRGAVSLDNRGGFLQAALDTGPDGALDGSGYDGVLLDVFGNGEDYNVHLRTEDVWLPWQAYRATFTAPAAWTTVRLPFSVFTGYRIRAPLDITALRRIGVLAIGRAFTADLCVARLGLYRDEAAVGY
jgi:adhesin HecA-like repeat protein